MQPYYVDWKGAWLPVDCSEALSPFSNFFLTLAWFPTLMIRNQTSSLFTYEKKKPFSIFLVQARSLDTI